MGGVGTHGLNGKREKSGGVLEKVERKDSGRGENDTPNQKPTREGYEGTSPKGTSRQSGKGVWGELGSHGRRSQELKRDVLVIFLDPGEQKQKVHHGGKLKNKKTARGWLPHGREGKEPEGGGTSK